MQIATLFRVCSIAGIMALSSANHIQAQSSRQISYQGVVTQGDTKISDGWYSLTFALYGSVGSSTPLWQEEQRVYFGHGLFNVMLGAVHPLPEHLPDDAWIGISFQGSGEFTRTKLTAVPFALQAEFAANAMRAEKAAELEGGVVTGINGIQGNVLMKASDGLEIRTDEDGGLIVGLSNEKRYEGILNQGTEWLLAGNSNANANSWLGTGNNFPLVIRTNNAERMRILSSNGNIGIGTISPAERVHIAGNAQIDGNVIIKPTSNTTGELRIMENGGAQYTAFKSPQLSSNVIYTLPINDGNNGDVLTSDGSGVLSWQSADGWGLDGNTVGAGKFLGTLNAQPLSFRTNNAERMIIGTTGNVAIGEQTTSSKLTVAQSLFITNTGGTPEIKIEAPNNTTTTIFKTTNQNANIVYTLPPDDGNNGQFLRTNGSGVLTWAEAGGLNHFSEMRNTTAPNATRPAHRIQPSGTEQNIDLVLSPKGTGAIMANIPNSGNFGGNKRGAKAVDWQMERTNANQVASGDYSTIAGGNQNTASAYLSTVSGGQQNTASGLYSTVGGGLGNTASTQYSTIGGGLFNTAIGNYSTIGGGEQNMASGLFSTISGGQYNIASGYRSAIGGGEQNMASGTNSLVGSGSNNTASGAGSMVGGGSNNTASGGNSTIAGGAINTGSEYGSSIGGGQRNTASGYVSTISGGWSNTARGDYSAIPGGRGLILDTNADRSFGFHANNVDGTRNMTISAANTAVFGNVDFWLANNDNSPRSLRFYEQYNAAGNFPNGANYVGFRAPNNISADITYTLPASAPTSNGQVLSSTTSGVLSWMTPGSTAMGGDLSGSADNAQIIAGAVGSSEIADNAILTSKIADGNITMSKLSQSGATNGQVLKWNGSTWSPSVDANTEYSAGTGISIVSGIISSTGDTDGSDDIVVSSTAGGDVSGTFSNLQIIAGAVGSSEIADNAILTNKIADGNITMSKLSQSGATNGQVLKWNGSTWSPSGDNSGMSNFSEMRNTTASNATRPVHQLSVVGSETHIDMALSPKGEGALTAHSADATYIGGDKRGQYAVDWQRSRVLDIFSLPYTEGYITNASNYVASGNYSVIGGGANNAAMGDYSNVGGGFNNIGHGQYATISGGNVNMGIGDGVTIGGGEGNIAEGVASVIGGGVNNYAKNEVNVIAGGYQNISDGLVSTISGGQSNTTNADYATVSGGQNNHGNGAYSSILGGNGLTLNGAGSIGYLGNNDGSRDMAVNADNTAVLGNINVWIINNDNTAHDIRLFEASNDGDNYTAFKAQAQNSNITYTLPASAPTNNGEVLSSTTSGVLSWMTPGSITMGGDLSGSADNAQIIAGAVGSSEIADNAILTSKIADGNITMSKLSQSGATNGQVLKWNGSAWSPSGDNSGMSNFSEMRTTSSPNEIRPVHQLSVVGSETHIDMALSPKGEGALTAHSANNAVSGGNKRGQYAVDFQTSRSTASQVASGTRSSIGGGEQNTASGGYSRIGGGYANIASGSNTVVSGGLWNTASNLDATISGGRSNTASGMASTISGGESNLASGEYSFVGGGVGNQATGARSSVIGGYNNRSQSSYSVVLGGTGMTLNGAASNTFGFLGANGGNNNMTIAAANTGVLANVDVWLANNDGTARELRFYEPNYNSGNFPNGTNYVAFKAPNNISTDIAYTLPVSAPTSNGQVLSSTTLGVLSWVSNLEIDLYGDIQGTSENTRIGIGAVDSASIANNAVSSVHIENYGITSSKIAYSAINSTHLSDSIVGDRHLTATGVTAGSYGGDVITVAGVTMMTFPVITVNSKGRVTDVYEQTAGITMRLDDNSVTDTHLDKPLGITNGATFGSDSTIAQISLMQTGRVINVSNVPLNLGGDVSGGIKNVTVTHLQHYPIDTISPDNGQVLQWNGSAWSPSTKSLKITVNNFDPDAVNAASFANFTVTANGVTTNDVVSLHRVGGFGDLIIASAYVNTNNQVTIRVYNPTASSVNLGAETLIIGIIRE